ncbi:MAG: heavy metal-associated domain-containing protein [Verrucomicrobiales bacterium]|nr:heavy metal-associated domain-containing protein [Verrucomicrobiales bacterium]
MNLIKKSVKKWAAMMVVAALGMASVSAADGDPDVKQEVRNVAAVKLLKERKDVSLLYVKGLVCPSCAIGIRVKVGKLPFVDSTRYKRGIDMDTKTQLLTIALLPGAKANVGELDKAITNAGYEPAEWYSLENGKLKATAFASAKKSK